MKNFDWKRVLPHVYAIAVFLIVSVIFSKPALEGKVLQQSDVIHWKGMAENSFKYKEKHGTFPLWTNGPYAGMPAYQIAMEPPNPASLGFFHNLFRLFLPKPMGFFFLLCISFYFLSQVLRVRNWIGVLGAIAYAYATFSCIITAVGHDTQMLALGYVPAVIGALLLLYGRNYIAGGVLTALFSALLVAMNHIQITYYCLIVAVFATIAFIIKEVKKQDYKHIVVSLAIAAFAGGIGAVINLVPLATTYDFSKATMRNGTTLDTTTNTTKKSGLPIDYAFNWSYGKLESFTVIVPGIYGGSSGGELKGESNLAKQAIEKGVPEEQATQFASQFPTYWGPQPNTSGPVYLGAIICFLTILFVVYVKSWHKWWMLAVCALAFLMSWGKNFEAFNTFLFNYLPLYNKFRAPSMTLVIPQLIFPAMAILALQQFLFESTDKAFAVQKLKQTGYVTAGILAILVLLYITFDYRGTNDETVKSYFSQAAQGSEDVAKSFYSAFLQDRKSLFGADLLRSIFFIAAAFAVLWYTIKNKMKPLYAVIVILILSSFDVLSVDKRYLNEDSYQEATALDESYFTPTQADIGIQKDKSFYRVLNLTQDVFTDGITSYHHNSIGGYIPARLSIVEDLLNFQLRNKQPMNVQVLNMLNTKYIINKDPQTNQPVAQTNPEALGPCWFAKTITYVNGPAAVMKALDSFNPKETTLLEDKSKSIVGNVSAADSSASITLVNNDNDYIEYTSNSKGNHLAVFSEIFYDRGWKAYVDGKETPIVTANYVLRAINVPAGQHKITFEFKPASYYTSGTIAMIASILIWLGIIGALVKYFLARKKEDIAISK